MSGRNSLEHMPTKFVGRTNWTMFTIAITIEAIKELLGNDDVGSLFLLFMMEVDECFEVTNCTF